MIQDQWRTGRTPENMEDNFGPSMVEPCYNPSIQDYLNNPSLVARKGYYDDPSGFKGDDDLPDPWNDEPLYESLPTDLPSKTNSKSKKGKKPDAVRTSNPGHDKADEKEDDAKDQRDDKEDE